MPNYDYIQRSDAINALSVSALLRNLDSVEDGTAHRYRRAAERIIAGVPAADVVPVVRCKDCKYKPTAPDGITYGLQVEFPDKWANRCPCLCEDGWYSWVPDDDFFCAYGAKEDGDGTV